MDLSDFENIEWLEPWRHETSEGFVAELRKEVNPDHELFGRQAITVGKRDDCDDVLFFLPHGPHPLAVVHLTWKMKTETSSSCPHTTFFSSLDDWIENGMKHDHEWM